MESFQFIDQTDREDGRVRSHKARKVIRSAVMKRHWAVDVKKGLRKSKAQPNTYERQVRGIKILPAESKDSSRAGNSNDIKNIQEVEKVHSPSLYLNRVTDGLIYGNSWSIDSRSLSDFSCHGSELLLGLCKPIEPKGGTFATKCCSISVKENSAALFYTLCYGGAWFEEGVRNHGRQDPQPSYTKAFMYKSAAISALNQSIAKSSSKRVISEATVCCVALLLLAASIDGRFINEVRTHRQGLSKIRALYGNIEANYPSLTGFFQLVDVKSSLAERSTPIFPLPSRLRGQFIRHSQAAPVVPSSCSSKLGTSFFSTKIDGRISPAIYECIYYIQHLMFIVEDYHTSKKFADLYDLDDFTTLEHVLLNLPTSSTWTNDPFNECLRLSLLIYLNSSLYKTPLFFGWMKLLLSDLKNSLILLDGNAILSETPEIFLWMLLLGSHLCSGQIHITGMGWWGSRLGALSRYMRIQRFEDAVPILEGVLFLDRSDLKTWRGTWSAVMDCSEEESLE